MKKMIMIGLCILMYSSLQCMDKTPLFTRMRVRIAPVEKQEHKVLQKSNEVQKARKVSNGEMIQNHANEPLGAASIESLKKWRCQMESRLDCDRLNPANFPWSSFTPENIQGK